MVMILKAKIILPSPDILLYMQFPAANIPSSSSVSYKITNSHVLAVLAVVNTRGFLITFLPTSL
jgi:hypothetical protein